MKNKGFFSRRRARLPAPFKVNCAESLLLQKRRLKAGYCCKARGDPLSTGRSSTHRGCWCGLWPGRTERGCRRAGGRAPQASPGPPLRRTQGSHTALEWCRGCAPGPLARQGQRPRPTAPTEHSEAQRTKPKQPAGQLLTQAAVPSRSGGPNRDAGRLQLGQQCGHGRLIRPQKLPSPPQIHAWRRQAAGLRTGGRVATRGGVYQEREAG